MDTNIPDITLIKVPKFLATQWRNSENHTIIGHCKRNSTVHIFKLTKIILQRELDEFKVKCGDKNRLFKCRKTTLPNPVAVQIDPKSTNLRFIGRLTESLTLFPSLDQLYKKELKERHISTNVQKARSTTNETREDPPFDSSDTIFKYYNPKTTTVAGMMASESLRHTEEAPYNRAKAKNKKAPTMDPDELKLKIFKIFELEEAKDGIQLKRLAQLTGQPLNNVKAAIEEIATQKRRSSDYKLVYCLNDLYNTGSSGI